MKSYLNFDISAQPDDASCGPTSLHAVYDYYGDNCSLKQVIDEVAKVAGGGTIPALLGLHALGRGYQAKIYTFELHLFDPTWFSLSATEISEKLRAQAQIKGDQNFKKASEAYIDFLAAGGKLCFQDLTSSLLRKYLKQGIPVLAGLSSTYLYSEPREHESRADDLRGVPAGHFVALCGYDRESRKVRVADPYLDNPVGEEHYYDVSIERLICSVLLGILTYDSCLLVIEPQRRESEHHENSISSR